jgi:hypothetical protein
VSDRPPPDAAEGPPASPFPQELVPQGPGPDRPTQFGARVPAQPAAPEPLPDAGVEAAVPVPDVEYIAQFNEQNALLRRIYDALTGRGRPPDTMTVVTSTVGLVAVRLRVHTLVLVTPTGGFHVPNLVVGTRAYTFATTGQTTVAVPFALVIEPGSNVSITDGVAYLIGHLIAAEGG